MARDATGGADSKVLPVESASSRLLSFAFSMLVRADGLEPSNSKRLMLEGSEGSSRNRETHAAIKIAVCMCVRACERVKE